jgi:hypothetical protein
MHFNDFFDTNFDLLSIYFLLIISILYHIHVCITQAGKKGHGCPKRMSFFFKQFAISGPCKCSTLKYNPFPGFCRPRVFNYAFFRHFLYMIFNTIHTNPYYFC